MLLSIYVWTDLVSLDYVGLQSSNTVTYLDEKSDKIMSPSYYKSLQVRLKTPIDSNAHILAIL